MSIPIKLYATFVPKFSMQVPYLLILSGLWRREEYYLYERL